MVVLATVLDYSAIPWRRWVNSVLAQLRLLPESRGVGELSVHLGSPCLRAVKTKSRVLPYRPSLFRVPCKSRHRASNRSTSHALVCEVPTHCTEISGNHTRLLFEPDDVIRFRHGLL